LSSSRSNSEPGGTAVFLIDSRLFSTDDLASFEQRLDEAAAKRLAGFVRGERRRQFILGRMLLRLAACRWRSAAWNDVTIEEGEVRPQLRFVDGRDLACSISHSRHWIGCAVADCNKLGLDLEVVDDSRDIAGLTQVGMEAAEAHWVLQRTAQQRSDAFYRLWCMKEALYKMEGISNLPAAVLLAGETAPLVTTDDMAFHVLPQPELAIAVCAEPQAGAPTITSITDLRLELRMCGAYSRTTDIDT
jgi:4'-phosphopantetheinyl transferase